MSDGERDPEFPQDTGALERNAREQDANGVPDADEVRDLEDDDARDDGEEDNNDDNDEDYGLGLDNEDDEDYFGFNPDWPPEFPHPFYVLDDGQGDPAPPCTLMELRMCALSATLRAKPQWWRKITDDTIVARWRSEALAQGLGEAYVDYVLAELRDYAALRDEESGIEVSCFDGIYQSDTLIPPPVLAAMQDGVRALEDVPEAQKDWHPRANGQVLDLVHPSLYPLVYGRTLVHTTESEGEGEGEGSSNMEQGAGRKSTLAPAEPPADADDDGVTSARFAWLPTDFLVSSSPASPSPSSYSPSVGVTRKGYINNLHPSHTALHTTLSTILSAFIPLFERVLTDIHPYNHRLFRPRIRAGYSYDESDPNSRAPPFPQGGGADAESQWEEQYEGWKRARPLVHPLPPAYEPGKGAAGPRKFTYSLRGRTVQVIVKLANIFLTPEKPTYPGGAWHVEGMKNECIVASGIYYYDEENITESRLAFRTAVHEPESYEQDDYSGVRQVWGLENNGPLVQDLGSVHTKAGRCTAFPNIYQHRVSPFTLTNPSLPGHRKILALFLVDPTVTIPSTSVVAPQQADWLFDTLRTSPSEASHLGKLPAELLKMVSEADIRGGHAMTRDEALKYREELMDERTRFVGENNEAFFGASFNMCEH